jgi:hypothetical protein
MATKPKKVTRTWDSYVKEASRPPFVLVVDPDTSVTIEAPTGDQVIRMEEMFRTEGSVTDALRLICGDAGEKVIELVREAPAGAMNQLMSDIMDHFNFGEALSGEAPSRT